MRRFVEHSNAALTEVLELSGRGTDASAQILEPEHELRTPSSRWVAGSVREPPQGGAAP